jgi:1,4-dihydroxy-2-naphthoate polyprenyltransferase
MTTDTTTNLPTIDSNDGSTDQTKDYRFCKALRPFSLFIALSSTGIVWARVHNQENFSFSLAILVVLGTVLAQAAVNLINDWSERHQVPEHSSQYQSIYQNFLLACACFGLATAMGIYITASRGHPIIWLAITGFIACLAYTFEPVNLKRRGLGLIAVFLVMGPVLMLGSSFAMTGKWHFNVLLDALMFAPLISVVLLANELRDHQHDQLTTDKTFTVRVGFRIAAKCFIALTIVTLLAYCLAFLSGYLRLSWVFLIPLAMVLWLIRFFVMAKPADLVRLPPLSGRLVLATGAAHILALLEV